MIENTIIKQLYDISPFYDIPFEYKNVEEIELYTLYRNRLNFVLPEQYEVDETNKRIYFPLRDGYQEPLPEGTKVLVIRRNDITQLEDSTKKPFKSNDIERSLDKLTKICQELSEELGRTIRYNKADDGTSETDAQFYIDYLNAQQKKTEDFAVEAEESARKASLSEQNAADSALSAKESSDTAKASELSAIESANAAREDRELADQYAREATESIAIVRGYKEDAELSAEHAATSEANALQYSDEAMESASTAMEEADKAIASANAAKLSETNAKTSELNAMASEGNAAQSEENAKDSEVKAEAALEQVLEKASETLVNAQEALRAKDIAVESMGRAVLAETNAKVSEDNSKESETSASESATSAEEYKNRCEEIFQRIGTAIKIKGRVDRLEDLPMVGNLDGDAYLVGAEGLDSYPEYYWYQNHWEFLGTSGGGGTWGTITGDITAQTDLKNALDSKQPIGNYALKSELPTIAAANKPGLVAGGNWLTVNQSTGKMECGQLTKAQYDSALGYTFISKTTLENRIVDKQDALNITLLEGATI